MEELGIVSPGISVPRNYCGGTRIVRAARLAAELGLEA